jgi:hypothetical protein
MACKKQLYPLICNELEDYSPTEIIDMMFNCFNINQIQEFYDHIKSEKGVDDEDNDNDDDFINSMIDKL